MARKTGLHTNSIVYKLWLCVLSPIFLRCYENCKLLFNMNPETYESEVFVRAYEIVLILHLFGFLPS